ncbi:MAG: hypothetical protein ABIU05_17265, partial [Nitrospirales bacterium]
MQERVLHYLRENGPIKWPSLYLYFDQDGKGEIGSAMNPCSPPVVLPRGSRVGMSVGVSGGHDFLLRR